MPDADRTHPSTPAGWGDAFAALPMETPPADGWQRLTRALDGPSRPRAHDRRRRWPLWLAAAAAVSAVALVPVLMRDPPPIATTPVASTTTQPAATTPAVADATQPDEAAADAIAKAPAAVPRKRRPSPTAPPHEVEPRRLVAVESPATADAANESGDLPALQAESAQLEALVALARDDRVASASSAALSVELDERIGRIDASLSQPALGDGERAALWRERVETMRELAGIETTRRWMTASGERYDGALVSVD
ncbi:MAG TPA: hypothetical protein VGD42_15675 [Lysobacter sp.]